MNIWEILGIPPTEDIGKIKSAYARQAKLHHPEEHPEEFKTLQNAYKIAIKLAKSSKAGITVTYLPSGQPAETPEDMPQREMDTVPIEAQEETEADPPQREPENRQNADESVFDFSGVDAYGDRERFLKQFLLLAKNPYLRNRLTTWDYFLQQNAFADLFSRTDFRKEWVQTICGIYGWRRKTILYLEHFLSSFHTQENKPEDGQWETDGRAFRLKKQPRLRLPAFLMDRFSGKEGRAFHKYLRKSVSKMAGREIDLDVELDLVRYIKVYLPYAESNEAYIDQLYRGWRFEQWRAIAVIVGICFFVVMTKISIVRSGQEAQAQRDYLLELYDLEAEDIPEKELEDLRRDYNTFWKYGEGGIDDVLERYERWER